jgi:hypothetical protein
MSFAFNVFVSSSCYELRDLRARLREWLSGMGFNPVLSEGEGFPHVDGMPPYASCLKTMDECIMVIASAFENRWIGLDRPTRAQSGHLSSAAVVICMRRLMEPARSSWGKVRRHDRRRRRLKGTAERPLLRCLELDSGKFRTRGGVSRTRRLPQIC